jgi:hypothetical protein
VFPYITKGFFVIKLRIWSGTVILDYLNVSLKQRKRENIHREEEAV